jgi:hypothetical protein
MPWSEPGMLIDAVPVSARSAVVELPSPANM